jgi:SAM-dependent methyltransferase
VVVSVEASHAYGNDRAFLAEVKRVLRPQGRFLYADYRTRRKVPKLERLARAAGLDGQLRDITANVVSACERDSERRRRIIQSNLPWHYRWLVGARIERYAGLPGTATFERFRGGDRMYFLTCMTPREHCAEGRL